MTDDLVAFLRAQLDEDTKWAKAALWAGDERWRAFHREVDNRWIVEDTYDEGVAVMLEQAADGKGLARHIVAWEPLRALREIEAKRRSLAELEAAEDAMDQASRERDTARYSAVRAEWVVLRRVVRRDAAVYAGRPGFREEWRP